MFYLHEKHLNLCNTFLVMRYLIMSCIIFSVVFEFHVNNKYLLFVNKLRCLISTIVVHITIYSINNSVCTRSLNYRIESRTDMNSRPPNSQSLFKVSISCGLGGSCHHTVRDYSIVKAYTTYNALRMIMIINLPVCFILR